MRDGEDTRLRTLQSTNGSELRFRARLCGDCGKRPLLVDTQGLVLEARVNSAKVVDQDGIKLLLRLSLSDRLSRLCYLWLDTSLHRPGGQGSRLGGEDTGVDGRDRTPPAQAGPHGGDDAVGSGVRNRGLGHRSEEIHLGARPFLPRRWVVERTFSWLGQNRRMSLGITSVYRRAQKPLSTAAMSRLMARRLARS